MISIVSKHIFADRSMPLIYQTYFDQIEDQLKGGPSPYYRRTRDSGEQKKTILDPWLGLGSNDRAPNAGAGIGLGRDSIESRDKSLSSGYNDGSQADDETGPGYTEQKTNPYYTVDTNEVFIDLKMKGKDDLDSMRSHVKNILDRPSVMPVRRYNVDEFAKKL